MLSTLVITLREGIEAFLIVAIMLAYLNKTGRAHLARAVYWGIGAAVVASIGASLLFAQAENKPLWEGLLALVAAVLVASLIVYMWRKAPRLRAEITTRLEGEARKDGRAAALGVFAFTLLMITREGMETALMLSALLFNTGTGDMLAGAALGVAAAAGLAWGWARYGKRVNLPRLLQVTAIFLAVFVVQLFIYSFHEFTEADILPLDNEFWHIATEPYGPEGAYGQWLTYSMVLIPAGWLLYAWFRDRRSRQIAAGPETLAADAKR
ncbi:MAG: FTR1 family protein [Betaproteobacteria bacterium]|nr:FTR1 family protein [Betaproteobacteria bacterium]